MLLIIWGWRPLWPETHIDVIVAQLNADAFTPLAGLSQRSDVFSAIHVAQQFLLYLPLGALLAVWPFRRRGPLAHLWSGIFLAIAIEIGHFVILDRTFDITNILLAISGLAMGWIAVRRSGYEVYGEATSPARRQVSRA